MIWKLQEEYHMDYKTAFFMAGEWRVLSPRRIHLMFGEMDDEEFKKDVWETRPECQEVEKELPKRNLPRIRPYAQDTIWWEYSEEDWHSK